MKRFLILLLSVIIIASLVGVYFLFLSPSRRTINSAYVIPWINNTAAHADWAVKALERCQKAPFIMPTSGLIGYLWDDSFQPGNRHQGIDVFGGQEPGVTLVFAAADGYLSRQYDWKSTVIIRVPADPFQENHQIWTYYTHMADSAGNSYIVADFPLGTIEVFVKAGTLLGYQGNYSGTSGNPVGVHLHFSIIRDDGYGQFLNELEIKNTLDPSPYLGLNLNRNSNPKFPILCNP
jgi:murein DD-endopeptidase MepM/ murein hydrolase activator NlpD